MCNVLSNYSLTTKLCSSITEMYALKIILAEKRAHFKSFEAIGFDAYSTVSEILSTIYSLMEPTDQTFLRQNI